MLFFPITILILTMLAADRPATDRASLLITAAGGDGLGRFRALEGATGSDELGV